MITELNFQIGKNGLTQGIISSLNSALKNHNRIRISTLKSSGRNKASIKLIAEEMIQKLDYQCFYRIIGFTIILKRQSPKPVKLNSQMIKKRKSL